MKKRAYLREMQYRDDTNLNARSALHERFSVNPVGLQRWVFDQLDLPGPRGYLRLGVDLATSGWRTWPAFLRGGRLSCRTSRPEWCEQRAAG